MPKQEGNRWRNQLDQAGETTEETGEEKPEQVEEMPKQEETVKTRNLIRRKNHRKCAEDENLRQERI